VPAYVCAMKSSKSRAFEDAPLFSLRIRAACKAPGALPFLKPGAKGPDNIAVRTIAPLLTLPSIIPEMVRQH